MKEKEILKEIIEWAESSSAYLACRTDYGKGYKNGIMICKEIVLDIIESHDKNILTNN